MEEKINQFSRSVSKNSGSTQRTLNFFFDENPLVVISSVVEGLTKWFEYLEFKKFRKQGLMDER